RDGHALEVVLVDDGSTDGTEAVARSFADAFPITVLVNEQNRGLGRTFRRGMLEAMSRAAPDDVVVALDADGSHLPGLALRMVQRISEGFDVVIASRFAEGAVVRGVPSHRQLLSVGMSGLFHAIMPLSGVRDFSCGYRAYRASCLQEARARYGDDLFAED